ncbi:hypothetical protein [Actinoplanes sp. N902-109]|uniref:hypothetical protein n=1 Tax=Actinoplanes sp. (strain N902-109) TaxID=649831 RepID=UPI000329439C|nr:hypothetical protein [Actinoplanes sp. N902-109]AGL13541.1 hypothetical protein L083_0031 [Actinoplanes sp. N902-109]
MTRVRHIPLLVGPLLRTLPIGPMAAGGALAVLAVTPALLGAPAPGSQVWGLRIAALLLGGAASFALVERMPLVAVTATPRWLRQWTRTALGVLPAVVVWLALFELTGVSSGDLLLEASAGASAGVAGAAVAARHGHSATTGLAGPATQALLFAGTLFLPTSVWDAGPRWWLAALGGCLLVLLAANQLDRRR